MIKLKKITFKDEPFLLIDGAITTEEAFRRGECSFAHFDPEKNAVWRFGELIGTGADIVDAGETVEITMSCDELAASMITMLDGIIGDRSTTWRRPD